MRLQQRMVEMEREKAELAERLVVTENQSKERERIAAAQLQRERDELLLTVQRMKAEHLEEKRILAEAMKNANVKSSSHHSGLALKSKSSLLDVLAEESEKSLLSSRRSSFMSKSCMSRDIKPIREVDETVVLKTSDDQSVNSDLDDEDDYDYGSHVEEDGEEEEEEEEDLDLPAPHLAAAKGDLNRLKELKRLNKILLTSFDESHRTPLFYAVAYDKFEAAEYLLRQSEDVLYEPDLHGDLPLHAATSAGSAQCVELLLKIMGTNLNCKNSMDMTPAHLVRNRECLELLHNYECNITTTDANGRSPLFVACAMNRADVAEYIIDYVDNDYLSLYVGDTRGDTPLHAAACNGSADCLLVLLQHAIDPRITNNNGLKAIDLAIRNKQHKCRELLAEYHLHFCTNSQMDSMLFLATLHGHKQVTHMLAASQPYEIIKKLGNDSISHADLTPGKLQSLFSLTDDRSLRLERFGSWIAYEDQSTQSTYYYNHRTRTGQWEVPDKLKRLHHVSSIVMSDGTHKLSTAKTSMRIKKIGEWIKYRTEMDQIFYYNEENGDFQWEEPDSVKYHGRSNAHDVNILVLDSPRNEQTWTGTDVDIDDTSAFIDTDLEDWRAFVDPESGEIFWYNQRTQISQWECPHKVENTLIVTPTVTETAVKGTGAGTGKRRNNIEEKRHVARQAVELKSATSRCIPNIISQIKKVLPDLQLHYQSAISLYDGRLGGQGL
eukprot:gene5527-11136_t